MNTEKLLSYLQRAASLARFLPYAGAALYWITMATVIYLIAGFFAPSAFAQQANETPAMIDFTSIRQAAMQGGDWSMALWRDVLGPFFADPFGQAGLPTTTLGHLFVVFNTCVFSVTLAYLGWGVMSGIVGTAHDGSAMGQRMNSSWYPIRVVTGIGGSLPVFGGYTASQAILAWLAVAGIGTANLMLTSVVKMDGMVSLTGTAHISGAPGVGIQEVAKTVEALTRSQICIQSAQRLGQQYKEAGAAGADWWLSYGQQTLRSKDGVLLRFGRPGDPEACGAVGVRLEKYREAKSSTSYRVASVDYEGIRANVSANASEQLMMANSIAAKLASDYLNVARATETAAAGVVSTGQLQLEVDVKAIEAAVLAYAADVNNLINKSLASGGSSIKQAAQSKMLDGGWLAAGSWYGTWAEANASLSDAVAGVKFSRAEPGVVTSTVDEDVRRFDRLLAAGKAALSGLAGNEARDSGALAVNEVQKAACGLAAAQTATGDCSIGQVIAQKIIGAAAYGSGGGASERDGVGLINPVLAFKSVGDFVMATGATLVGAQVAAPILEALPVGRLASVAGVVSGSVGEGDKGFAVAGSRAAAGLASAGWMLLVLGGLMAIYLPLLPFISWFAAIVSYVASMFEGFVAMPLHAMAHMHTDGEGMGQQTSQGYLFYLNVFARPPLMLLTFFFAASISIGLGTLLAKMFIPAMANLQGDSTTGLASVVGLLIVYFILNVVMLQSIFDLIQVLPDQVIQFVGAGQLNSPLGKETEGKVNALFASAQRSGQATGMGSAGSMAKEMGKGKGRGPAGAMRRGAQGGEQ